MFCRATASTIGSDYSAASNDYPVASNDYSAKRSDYSAAGSDYSTTRIDFSTTVSGSTSVSSYAATIVSDSLDSISESPIFSRKDDPKDNTSDIDFSTKAYLNELLENGLKEERFRIDRKKLEDMLQVQQNPSPDLEDAEEFFQRVMCETSTQISWPSKLKIGAKSKKDPHVKIVGKPEAVQLAKEKILEILDTKKNRVTLKMDVSHTTHSYIIGKGGFKIQQVMEETGCHIHFPDSNRNSSAEKSNQVSIAGQAAGVEQARTKIREYLPIVFTFELPNGEAIKPSEYCSPAVQHIQQTYSFNVSFKSMGPVGLARTVLEVRGCQKLLSRLRQGLSLLMQYLIGSQTLPVMGFMKTEIAAQHHQFVMGPCNSNIQNIMNKTGATIVFPDTQSHAFGTESPSQAVPLVSGHSILRSKSTVVIQGSFDSVCLAWQELLKCLPLVLMFDLKEGQELDPVMVNNFMEAFNINIMVRPKMKENTKSVLIRGAEKDSKVLFQVRKDILCLDEEDSYPISPSMRQNSFRMPTIETCVRMPHQSSDVNIVKTPGGQGLSTAESLSILSNIIQQNPQIVGLLNNLSTAFPSNGMDMPQTSAPPVPNTIFRNHVLPNPIPVQPNQYPVKNVESWINRPDRSYAFTSGISVSNFLQKDRQLPIDDGDSGIFVQNRNKLNGFETKSYMRSQPESSASSTSSNDTQEFKSPRFSKNEFQKECSMTEDMHRLLVDYENKKIMASKVKQQSADGVRTPNHVWSGYGFSKSMPDFAARAKREATNSGSISEYLETDVTKISNIEATASKVWNADMVDKESQQEQVSSPFALSNFWENTPCHSSTNYSSIMNLEQLLCLLDLENYNDLFIHHEIDLPTFLTLTENDLQQLDVNYRARRKMLTAIAALREQRLEGWPSRQFHAAPGAERRTFYRYSGTTTEENSDRM